MNSGKEVFDNFLHVMYGFKMVFVFRDRKLEITLIRVIHVRNQTIKL